MIDSEEVIEIFNKTFKESYRTQLVKGADEPFYAVSKSKMGYHSIYFRENMIQSAFHEIAHWCIAGDERRKFDDYGYWYNPDSRTLKQQLEFYRVEIEPQALEKIFTETCKMIFTHSLDIFSNRMNLIQTQTEAFILSVNRKSEEFKSKMPYRAGLFNKNLREYFEAKILS